MWFVDRAKSRREFLVGPAQQQAILDIVYIQIEAVETHAANQIKMITDADLVLHIERQEIEVGDSAAVERRKAEGRHDNRVGQRNHHQVIITGGKQDITPGVGGLLLADLVTKQQAVTQTARIAGPQQIALTDKIFAIGRVDITVEGDGIADRGQPDVIADRVDRIDIAIELVIVSILRGRTEAQLVAEIMFHAQLHDMSLQSRAVGAGLAE